MFGWVAWSDAGPSCAPSFLPSAFCFAPEEGAPVDKRLDVHVRADGPFEIAWVRLEDEYDRRPVARDVEDREGGAFFPALRAAIVETGEQHHAHRDPADRRFDRAVLRVGPGVRTTDVLGVRATILSILRPRTFAGESAPAEVPAFDVGVLPDP